MYASAWATDLHWLPLYHVPTLFSSLLCHPPPPGSQVSPEELTDLAAGVSAAGVKSPATAALLDGVAAAVTMQLANRHSRGGSGLYTPQHLLGLLQAFASAQYTDGELGFPAPCADASSDMP
jgi:hypothetical protein